MAFNGLRYHLYVWPGSFCGFALYREDAVGIEGATIAVHDVQRLSMRAVLISVENYLKV
jgi:hypothetical protein